MSSLRFIYLADTHIGTDSPGYRQQPAHPGRIGEILAALTAWISQNGGVDFILHGGDMADVGTPEAIASAAAHFRTMPVPVYLCLGNHDLTEPESLPTWLALYPEAFPAGGPEYSLELGQCAIHVVPNHWSQSPHLWRPGENTPVWHAGQWAALEARYQPKPGQPQILVTHAPVFGLPPGQTGLTEPLHPSDDTFVQPLVAWVADHPEVVAVLGAHNHLNMRVAHEGVHYVTASSLSEAPFEFKLFEVTPRGVAMQTIALAPALPFDGGYDTSRPYVQGREVDRAFDVPLERS